LRWDEDIVVVVERSVVVLMSYPSATTACGEGGEVNAEGKNNLYRG